jgi:hypothetical protein
MSAEEPQALTPEADPLQGAPDGPGPLKHLSAQAARALGLPDAERIDYLRQIHWIGYTRAKAILEELDDLLTHPPSHRMPCLLVVGETNNGKTVLVNRFAGLHPGGERPDGEGIEKPVLVVQAPAGPAEAGLFAAILDALHAPYRISANVDLKRAQALALMRRVGVRVLIIDELHPVVAGTTHRHRHMLNVIKHLSNELQIPIVGAGTRAAFHALQSDPQLSNRFEPAVLPRWEHGQEYLRLLVSFERALPLRRPSDLVEERMALKLLGMIDGKIGELARLLAKAAVKAVQSGAERIDRKTLDAVRWVAPAERRQLPPELERLSDGPARPI